MNDTPKRIWVRPAGGDSSHFLAWGEQDFDYSTEYVRADVLAEALWLLARLADAYEIVCGDTGKNYHQSPGSYYAHARAFLSRQPEPSGLPQHAPHPAGGAEGITHD